MSALFLTESDVEQLLSMDMAIAALTEAFRQKAEGSIDNAPRARVRAEHSMLHILGAAVKTLGVMGVKVYSTTRAGARFLVHLYDCENGELLAVMEANFLGAIRTGAASGVATNYMSRPESDTVGVFGSGWQARTQLEAVCVVRDIVEAYVYSPNTERRQIYAQEMSAELGLKVVPVHTPELAAEDKDIVITATKSATPILFGEWISPGTHLNVIGSNFLTKSEIDVETVRMCDPIVVDDREQAQLEAGDFVQAVEEGIVRWSDVVELGQVVAGSPGRHGKDDVTLFKSVGIAMEDVAIAKAVYDEALKQKLGVRLPF